MLAFRLARSGEAPASDFSHDAALFSRAARDASLTRERYDAAVDAGDIVVAHSIRGAIHAVATEDRALWGRALISGDDTELGAQLGRQVQRLTDTPVAALDAVTEATEEVLRDGPLDRTDLHAALRGRVPSALTPWCEGCGSHHVAPMLWRYATAQAGARLDASRRYRLTPPPPPPAPEEAVRRFLRVYGPSTLSAFAEWAGLARAHAQRLWDACDLAEAHGDWMANGRDAAALGSPPAARGVLLLPPGDPFLQTPNRALLAPDPEVRKRLFRPVASPGAVIRDGRLAGLWRARMKGRRVEVTVEPLVRIPKPQLQEPAARVAALRGGELSLVVA